MNEFLGELTLDLDCRKTMPKISAGQYDKGRKYLIHITAGGADFSTTDSMVIIQGIRRDKSRFSSTCPLDDNGNVILELSDEILSVSGFAYAKLILSDSNKNYSTQVFVIDVEGSYEGDITVDENYSIVNDFMNKLMLLFELDDPSDMLNTYPRIKDITAAELDEAIEKNTIYDVYSETGAYRKYLYRIMCIPDRDIRTQYRFSATANTTKRSIDTRVQARNVVKDTWLEWSKWSPIVDGGVTIIDEETSADWDGEIPDDYEGERGALALYDGGLWYLDDIAEYEQSPGRKFYYWVRIATADDLAAIEADLYSKMSLAPINPTDEQIATLRTGQLYVGENTLAVTTGSGGSKSAYDTKYVDEALSAKQNKIAIWSDGKKDLFRYADKSTYFKVGDYVYANGRTYRLFSVTATSYINDNAKYEYYWVCYPKITRVASLKTKESVSSISVAGFNGITRNSWNVYDLAYVNNDGLYVCTDAKVLENVSPKNPREYEYVWKKLAYLPDDVYTKTEIDAKLGDIESLLSQV